MLHSTEHSSELDKSAIISVKILDEQPFVEPVLLPRGKAIYIEAMEMK